MPEPRSRGRGEHSHDAHASTRSPLPRGWLTELTALADLERSFERLAGRNHFFAEAMRGFVRSLQGRYNDAWEHFDKAYEAALLAEETIPNLVWQFQLNVCVFENALLEAPVAETGTKLSELWIPELPEETLDEYPEVRFIVFVRQLAEAQLRLHLGESHGAARIGLALIDDQSHHGVAPDHVAVPYLAVAASAFNLGHEEDARRYLQKAAAEVMTSTEALVRARDGAALLGLSQYMGNDEAAASWKKFIEQVECPRPTRESFLCRAELARERCEYRDRAVVM